MNILWNSSGMNSRKSIYWNGTFVQHFCFNRFHFSFSMFLCRSSIQFRNKRHVNNNHTYFSDEKVLWHFEMVPTCVTFRSFSPFRTYPYILNNSCASTNCHRLYCLFRMKIFPVQFHFQVIFNFFLFTKSHLNPFPMIRKQHFIQPSVFYRYENHFAVFFSISLPMCCVIKRLLQMHQNKQTNKIYSNYNFVKSHKMCFNDY